MRPRRRPEVPACRTQAVADMAGALSEAVMAGEVTLARYDLCRIHLRSAGYDTRHDAGFDDAFAVAAAMIEDRARRALAFGEPRR